MGGGGYPAVVYSPTRSARDEVINHKNVTLEMSTHSQKALAASHLDAFQEVSATNPSFRADLARCCLHICLYVIHISALRDWPRMTLIRFLP